MHTLWRPLLGIALAVALPVRGETAQRIREHITWPAAASAAPQVALTTAQSAAVAIVALPVLLPPVFPPSATLVTSRDGYSLSYKQNTMSVVIDGTRIAYRAEVPLGLQTNVAVRGRPGFASVDEASPVVTWSEFGAAYRVAVECENGSADPLCASVDSAVAIAQSLVFMGGSGQTLPEEREPIVAAAQSALPADFSYTPAGELPAGSGSGQRQFQELVPPIRFPIEKPPAFANSQVFGHGGDHGPAGTSQCDGVNFSYPWHDNFCESRPGRKNAVCPAKEGHQGQDIRAADCKRDVHRGVSVVGGTISHVGSYSVTLTDPSTGVRYRYLHMSHVSVKAGDEVHAGDPLGLVSNILPPDGTTVHLHFEAWLNVQGFGIVPVGPYTALIDAYRRLLAASPPVAATAPVATAQADFLTEAAAPAPKAETAEDFDVKPPVRGYPGFGLPAWAYAATTMAWWKGRTGATPAGTVGHAGEEFAAALEQRQELDLTSLQQLGTALGLKSAIFATTADAYGTMFKEDSPGWLIIVDSDNTKTPPAKSVGSMFIVTGVHNGTEGLKAHLIDPLCDRRAFDVISLMPEETVLLLYFPR